MATGKVKRWVLALAHRVRLAQFVGRNPQGGGCQLGPVEQPGEFEQSGHAFGLHPVANPLDHLLGCERLAKHRTGELLAAGRNHLALGAQQIAQAGQLAGGIGLCAKDAANPGGHGKTLANFTKKPT